MDMRISVRVPASLLHEREKRTVDGVGSLRMYESKEISGYSVAFSFGDLQVLLSADRLKIGDREQHEFLLNVPNNENDLSLRATNRMDYIQFAEAINLTRSIVDMKLQLGMCLREVFCDGVFASNKTRPLGIDNLGSLLAEASSSVLATLGRDTVSTTLPLSGKAAALSPKIVKAKTKSHKTQLDAVQQQPAGRLNYCCMTCVYCDTPGSVELLTLKVHPYVPVTMDRQVVYLCEACHFNWLSYRQEAAKLKLLVLAGEYSEEVCAVCSDSPTELVLCSSCPRSYCNPCLAKLLTPKQSAAMAIDEQWRCLCCVHSEQAFRGFARSLNLCITSQTCPCPLALGSARPPPKKMKHAEVPVAVSTTALLAQISSIKAESTAVTQAKSSLSSSKRQRCSLAEDLPPSPQAPPPLADSKRSRPSLKRLESEAQSRHRRASVSPSPKKSDKKKKMEGKTVGASASCPAGLPSTSQKRTQDVSAAAKLDLDEVYYFSQYVNMRRCNQPVWSAADEDAITESEDFCFLCKDGGDLLECDHGPRGKSASKCPGSSSSSSACKKVYHAYCLGYEIPDEQRVWNCMWHFCSECSSGQEVAYQCQYCPMAWCRAKCFQEWNDKHKFTTFSDLRGGDKHVVESESCGAKKHKKKRKRRGGGGRVSSLGGGAMPVICGFCVSMFERSIERQLLSRDKCQLGVVRDVAELLQPGQAPRGGLEEAREEPEGKQGPGGDESRTEQGGEVEVEVERAEGDEASSSADAGPSVALVDLTSDSNCSPLVNEH